MNDDQRSKADGLAATISAYLELQEDEWAVKDAVVTLQRACGGVILGGGQKLWHRLEIEMRTSGECAPPDEGELRSCAQDLYANIVDFYGLIDNDNQKGSSAPESVDGYDWSRDVADVEADQDGSSDGDDVRGVPEDDGVDTVGGTAVF